MTVRTVKEKDARRLPGTKRFKVRERNQELDRTMSIVAQPVPTRAINNLMVGIADAALAQRLAHEIERFAHTERIRIVSSLSELRQLSRIVAPAAILIDDELLGDAPVVESLRELAMISSVIFLAPLTRQAEITRLTAGGEVEFVARSGDFIPHATALLERRLRWAGMSESVLGPPWGVIPGDFGTIFRHEINNPLTGILGNAELLLAHRERLSTVDIQRLQTVVDLAVRLRETIRRLSNAWESQPHSLKSA